MQSLLFSAVFYGSFVTVLFSGYLADKYGPRLVVILGLTAYIILSLSLPTITEFHFYALVAARFVMGIAEVRQCFFIKPKSHNFRQKSL